MNICLKQRQLIWNKDSRTVPIHVPVYLVTYDCKETVPSYKTDRPAKLFVAGLLHDKSESDSGEMTILVNISWSKLFCKCFMKLPINICICVLVLHGAVTKVRLVRCVLANWQLVAGFGTSITPTIPILIKGRSRLPFEKGPQFLLTCFNLAGLRSTHWLQTKEKISLSCSMQVGLRL